MRDLLIFCGLRFIPAGAGNRSRPAPGACSEPVHPRWRGEQLAATCGRNCRGGSSPLARGTGAAMVYSSVSSRFIPAGAGNRRLDRPVHDHATVHPRWRGEQGRRGITANEKDGSSPLARGTDCVARQLARLRRFIPAGAGNRGFCRTRNPQSSVHPRWRGDQLEEAVKVQLPPGSSPLARGTADEAASTVLTRRFIPAGAGNRAKVTAPYST